MARAIAVGVLFLGVAGCGAEPSRPPRGELRWARGFGGAAHDFGSSVAFEAGGALAVAGRAGDSSSVTWLDAEGAQRRAVAIDGALPGGLGIAAHPDGDTLVYGAFEGAFAIGDQAMTSLGGADVALSSLRPDGRSRWVHRYGNERVQRGLAVRADPRGRVTISGFSEGGVIDFGGGPRAVEGRVCGNFVAQLDGRGAHRWSRLFTADDNVDWGLGIAVDPSGAVLAAGQVRGDADLGGGLLPGGPDLDLVVARFDPGGALLWSARFGDAADQRGSVAAARDGSAFLFGRFEGTLDLGAGALTTTTSSGFVAMLSPDGEARWSRAVPGDAEVYGAAVDADDHLVLAGHFSKAADFGCGPMVSAGGRDAFVAKLDRRGACMWSRRFGDARAQWAQSVAVDAEGAVAVTGAFEGTLAPAPLASAGGYDLFVLTIDP